MSQQAGAPVQGTGLFSKNTLDTLISYANQGTNLFSSIQNAVKGNTDDGTKAKQETVQSYEASSVATQPKPAGFTLDTKTVVLAAGAALLGVVLLLKK
jgi:hypothetical protein